MLKDYVKISCKKDVYICCTNFVKKIEWNLHETTSQWKTYGKQLFSEGLEARDVGVHYSRGGEGSFVFCRFFNIYWFCRYWMRELLRGTERANLSVNQGIKSIGGIWRLKKACMTLCGDFGSTSNEDKPNKRL